MILKWESNTNYLLTYKLINYKTNEIIYTIQTIFTNKFIHQQIGFRMRFSKIILLKGNNFSINNQINDDLQKYIIEEYFEDNIEQIKTSILRKYKIEKLLN